MLYLHFKIMFMKMCFRRKLTMYLCRKMHMQTEHYKFTCIDVAFCLSHVSVNCYITWRFDVAETGYWSASQAFSHHWPSSEVATISFFTILVFLKSSMLYSKHLNIFLCFSLFPFSDNSHFGNGCLCLLCILLLWQSPFPCYTWLCTPWLRSCSASSWPEIT